MMYGINGCYKSNSEINIEKILNVMCKNSQAQLPSYNFINESIALNMKPLYEENNLSYKPIIMSEDKSKVLAFSGSLTDADMLKKGLIENGHRFETDFEEEIIIHLYEDFKYDCVKKLSGKFAFAIYDKSDETLFIARDHLGQVPLYYFSNNEILLFSSKLEFLMNTGIVKKEINQIALSQYFQLTYIPAPLTIFENVKKLEAATYMIFSKDNQVKKVNYWNINVSKENEIEDYDMCKKMLRDSLTTSVEKRLSSNKKIGTFLSGGIDSTIMTALTAKISDKKISTFTIGYNEKDADESDKARIVAEEYKTDHHEYKMNANEVTEDIDFIIKNMDEPFADSSLICTYFVSKKAKECVDLVLTGDCGDELFAGYSKYLIGYYSSKYNSIPKPIRKGIFEPVMRVIPDKNSLMRKVNKVISNSSKPIFDQRYSLMCLGFKADEIDKVIKNYKENNLYDYVKSFYDEFNEKADEITKAQYSDLKVVLEGDMFPKSYNASLFAHLETSSPLTDIRNVELAYHIPSKYKINNKNLKIILKETFSDLIPSTIINAAKHGFSIPIDYWLRNELKQNFLSLIEPKFLEEQGIFNQQYIKEITDEHMAGKKNRLSELWAIYVFQQWYKNTIKK